MPDNAHDPPAEPTAPRGYQPEPPIPAAALAPLRGRGHEKYALMTARLNAEPLEVIRTMKHGGHRYKSKRGYPGVLVLDRRGDPVPDRMSFRQIAPILSVRTGVEVTYETVRRWWEAVFPGEPDEPDEETADLGPDREEVPHPQTRRARRRPVAIDQDSDVAQTLNQPVKRATRRRTPVVPVVPVVGDDHAETIRAAMAKAASTNPEVPPAAFLPPAVTQ